MSKGSILIYTSAAGQAAPLAGAALTVLDESGTALAHLTADADGRAEAADLPAPDAAYSLDAANTMVRPYALYRIEAALEGWQSLVLDGVQVFDGQQTVARLALLPRGTVPDAARSSEAEEVLPGSVLSRVVIPKKITVHLGKPTANTGNVTVSFQSYIANVASSEVYPTWEGVPPHASKPPVQLNFPFAILRRADDCPL